MSDGPARSLPVPLTAELLARGQERYNIYCTVCHGRTGDGKSVIVQRKAMRVLPPSYFDQRLMAQPVGYFYKVISEGVRNMRPYARQIPVEDRWAIAAYVRALQLAGSGKCEQVPAAVRAEKGWSCK
jgi:mono/diheme cytochrome c family protein